MTYVLEIVLFLVSIISGILGFFIKRLYSRVDEIEDDLVEHRVEDARSYITREEHDTKMLNLKDDIRGMISPIRQSVENIEQFLRQHKK